jgi:hypothetical protein
MSLVPRVKAVPAEVPPEAEPVIQVIREQLIVKEAVQPKGWRFVPHRDENNLITEIIATPIL